MFSLNVCCMIKLLVDCSFIVHDLLLCDSDSRCSVFKLLFLFFIQILCRTIKLNDSAGIHVFFNEALQFFCKLFGSYAAIITHFLIQHGASQETHVNEFIEFLTVEKFSIFNIGFIGFLENNTIRHGFLNLFSSVNSFAFDLFNMRNFYLNFAFDFK